MKKAFQFLRQTRAALLCAVALLAGAILAACSSVQQAVDAYGSVAVSNAKAANDTMIEAYKVALCALPLSALTRHPELVPAVRSLCIKSTDPVAEQLLRDVERMAEAPK